jgi:hypothetical protein
MCGKALKGTIGNPHASGNPGNADISPVCAPPPPETLVAKGSADVLLLYR